MNIIELEEGLHNLIATQPAILNGPNGAVISGIKSIIEAHKVFSFRLEEYPEQDILKIGLLNESSKLELNFTSYVCQILQERGINIMLYVSKYAGIYNQEINKYIDKIEIEKNIEQFEKEETAEQVEEIVPEKFVVVEKNNVLTKETVEPVRENKSQPVEKKQLSSQSKGRDYLMDLLKK